MSKAFSSADPPAWAPPPTLPSGRRPITPDGLALRQASMQAHLHEHAQLAARAQAGDSAALAQRRELDGKMAVLARLLSLLDVVPPRPGATLSFGGVARVRDAEGREHHYRVVGPDEADAAVGWVSHLSPVGRALLGRHSGDTVEVERPRGAALLTVLEVVEAPGAAAQAGRGPPARP